MDTPSDPAKKRARKNHRETEPRGQKAEIADPIHPNGPLIWFHLSNDNSILSCFGLIERLRLEREDLNFLITNDKLDGFGALAGLAPRHCQHQHLPLEDMPELERFLNQWQPECCLWGDMALKAAVLEKISTRKIPMFLIDADLPDERQQKLRWFPRNARKMLDRFDLILAVNGRTAHNMKRLGISSNRVEVLGRLEEAAPPLDFVQSDRDAMATQLASRPVWLAAGITEAEEDLIVAAHRNVLRRAHRLLLILEPEKLARGSALAEKLEAEDWQVALRSKGQDPAPDTQVFIADQPCERGLWLRLSPVTFFGGSLDGSERISHNPFQASVLGSAVLHGPHMEAFENLYTRLHRAGAAIQVGGQNDLAFELEMLLSPDKAAEMARAAWEVSTSGSEVSDRLCALVFNALDARGL